MPTVDIFCPNDDCGCEIPIELELSGQHIKATRYSPEEWPELHRISDLPDKCPSCEHVFTPAELQQLDFDADKAVKNFDVADYVEEMTAGQWEAQYDV